MDERIARLRTHQKNIERYQDLLKTDDRGLEPLDAAAGAAHSH
jgi:hypothetical protein